MPMENVQACISTTTNKDGVSTSIINPNKLMGDAFSAEECETAVSTILANSGISDYRTVRADLRLDSYNPTDYQTFSKLNKYLISAIAVTYKVQNCYRATDLFSDAQLSIAIKNRYFQLENYDKIAESGGTDLAAARFEERSLGFDIDMKKSFTVDWFHRWDKALNNLDKVQERYNDELVKIYERDKNSTPRRFLSLREFLMHYQDSIFTRKQMIDLLTRIGETENPEAYAKSYKKRYGIEWFSKKDVEYAISEIKRATL